MFDDAWKWRTPPHRPDASIASPRSSARKRFSAVGADPAICNLDASGLNLVCVNGRPVPGTAAGSGAVQLWLKRCFDIIGALFAIFMFSPALIGAALAIRMTSPGPVLFTHTRAGLNGAPISVYKFRSMHHACCDAESCSQTELDDPRITPVGQFLRRTSIDELPQLINVLKGEMSLVGPRPHAIGMRAAGASYRVLVPYYAIRQTVRPGMTGWAQANGLRGALDTREAAIARIEHDIAYIQNFSLWLDLRILTRTILREFVFGTGR